MPFLIPALVSGLSDVLILVLQEHRKEGQEFIADLVNGSSTDDDAPNAVFPSVHHVQYLALAAVLRLLLLLFPLPYHSYTGTAIKFPFCYQLFYGITLAAVLVHMLVLSMIDPNSIANFLPPASSYISTVQQQLSQSCWWILLLSLLSVLSHIVMLVHVRSTAPSIEYLPHYSSGNRKKRLVYYYASRQSIMAYATGESANFTLSTPQVPDTPMRRDRDSDVEQDRVEYRDALLSTRDAQFPASPMQKLSIHYDEFVNEIQSRILLLKHDWTHKLDDFTQRHLNIITTTTNQAITNHQHNNPLLPLTPFRVLLQLFAYQDVIDSGKLDAVFDMDQGQSMTFFVPQLLSFLLHGAYYEADPAKLEAWILDKCSKHVHFAHRCYWFLKAWSLQDSYQTSDLSTSAKQNPFSNRSTTGNIKNEFSNGIQHARTPSERSLSTPGSQSSFASPHPRPTSNQSTGANTPSRSNSLSSLAGGIQSNGGISNKMNGQKLLPEERAVVEDLMLRVEQCGEQAARILQFGLEPQMTTGDDGTSKGKRRGKRDRTHPKHQLEFVQKEPEQTLQYRCTVPGQSSTGLFWDQEDEIDDTSLGVKNSPTCTLVPELVLTPEMVASLPLDPSTGFPSQRHLEALTASHRFGFMPWANAKKQLAFLQAHPTKFPTTDSFHATPRFVDALLAISDGLFLLPRDQRQSQLRQQLLSLEVDMLPSNAIYLPISNAQHRVWRVLSEESIALNTKERVPCIILFEVVDCSLNDASKPTLALDGDDSTLGDDGRIESLDAKRMKEKRLMELPKVELPKLGMSKKPNCTKSSGDNVNAKHDSNEVEAPLALSLNSATSATLPFSLPYYTMMGGLTEAEIVNEWRYGRRDPHRGESILDKMTSSLPLDMTRMKERIHQLRDKHGEIFHDLLGLPNLDDLRMKEMESGFNITNTGGSESWLAREADAEVAAFLCNDTYDRTKIPSDIEANMNVESKGRDLSPEREPLDVSMGQWTSPSIEPRKVSMGVVKDSSCLQSQMKEIPDASNPCQDSMFTAYGSTYDGRGRTGNIVEGQLPPRSRSRTDRFPSVVHPSPNRRTLGNRPSEQVVFRENWQAKEDRLRPKSAFGSHPGWRLLPVLVKANDDLRQEQLASQLIQKMAFILARERVPVWLCPYEIIATTNRGGIVEAIPDTISLDSLKRNDPFFVDLNTFFHSYFGDNVEDLADAKSNFVESLAGYSIVTYLLQVKDRHNGNILLDNRGHLIHIDFGFFFLSSPGKNTGFESAPFKLTRDFVEVLGGPESHSFRTFRELCVRSFLVLRRHCMEIILLVEMVQSGNEDLSCFLGRPDEAIKGLRERFRLDLSDRACREYVQSLIDESLENWRTNWYDRYQRYCVGVL